LSASEIYSHHERAIDPRAVCALYREMEWWPERTEEEVAAVLDGDVAVGVWDGDQLVGFARVISDRHFHAYVEDVMVHPAYQHKGIGSLILARLLEALSTVETVTLFCKADLVPFYEQQGFRAFPEQMVMHRK